MFPAYTDMNSYPYPYPYQTPFPPCNNLPTWDGFRPQTKEDATNPRPVPQHWPYNHGHPAPTPCQNCCTNVPQPSYYNFTPPYPHFPMMPPSYGHYYGGYPPYPYVPPPHFSMPEAFHCCECPNHPSHVKKSTNNNVVIEEHHPEVEAKKAVSELSAPAVLSNSSHPLLWAKPRQEIEGCKLNEPQVDVEKPKKGIEQEPNVRYGWFPLDVDGIKRLMEGGELVKPHEKKDWDEKKTKMADHVEKKEQNKQFPFPIIWMPYGVQGEDHTTKGQEEKNINKTSAVEPEARNTLKRSTEETPSTFPSPKHPNIELVKGRAESDDDVKGVGTRGGSKTFNNVKIIPVKQLDDPVPVPKKKEQEGEESKSVKNEEDKPSSPTKKSKSLPPICLRVDPPRKKNGKASSRSPSPPGKKTCQELRDDKEERKDKEIVENNPNGNGVVENGSSFVDHQSEVKEKVCEFDENDVRESRGVEMSKPQEPDGPEKRMSETEAAVIIQSVYRGYVVRRWEPLKKLRQIVNVREEARKVGGKIEKLESGGNVENKEKVAVGETIMNLLLKLDTIQGLHPSVRDVRKSVATELIRLQEKLDSIVSCESVPLSCSAVSTEALEQPKAVDLNEDSAGSVEAISDASKVFDLGQKEEVVPPMEAWVDQSTDEQHSEDTSAESGVNKDQEENPDTESTQESITDDVSRMEWECDLGAVKNALESIVAEESPKETAEQILGNSGPREKCDEDVASVIESEMVAEIHAEDFKENNIENESNGVEIMEQQVENSTDDGTLCIVEPITEVEQQAAKECQVTEPPEENAERIEDDICRMDWECDAGAARFTRDIDQDTAQLKESSLELENESSVIGDSKDQVDQLSDKPQLQCDNADAAIPENPVLDAESRDETITEDAGYEPAPEAVPYLEPVTEVEKQVIEECGPEQLEEERTNSNDMSRRIIEENEKLREMVEKLVACGKEQQEVISSLTAKVSNLEKKIPKRRSKVKSSKRPRVVLPHKPVA